MKLPNGKHVTFGFVPGNTPEDFECVDIHSTIGKRWKDMTTVGEDHYEQKLIGFAKEGQHVRHPRAHTQNRIGDAVTRRTAPF